MNALITKLPGVVSDDSLMKIDELRVEIESTTGSSNFTTIRTASSYQSGGQVRIVGDETCYFTNSSGTENYGQIAEYSKVNRTDTFYLKGNSFTLFIGKKYDLESISFPSKSAITGGSLKYSSKLDSFIGYNLKAKSIYPLADICTTSLKRLFLATNVEMVGDVEDFANVANMTAIELEQSYIGGNMSVFESTTKFTNFKITYPKTGRKLSGLISALSGNKSMTYLNLTSQDEVTGTLESLLDGLFSNGKVSGNITIHLTGTGVTYNSSPITSQKTATFSSSGWTLT